jgi:exodeoxyribonuclease V alpha subunit
MYRSRVREEDQSYQRPLDVLECSIERVTYHNEENGYSVLKVYPADVRDKLKADVIPVIGNFPNPVVGESLRIHGWWDKHPQHGRQFKAEKYEVVRPATAAAMEKYLGSGMIKGIGPKTAQWMVKKFGEKTLDIIEHRPEKLTEIKGIGEKKAELIQRAYAAQKEIAEIMKFLVGHGITPTYAVKIYRHYKERAIEQVEKNPYQLATDIWGIGFKSADKIARNLGVAHDAPERLEAGLVYVLNQEMEGSGHCYLPENKLLEAAAENLYLKPTDLEPDEYEVARGKAALAEKLTVVLEDLIRRMVLVSETIELMGVQETAIYTPSFHATEKAVAERVRALLASPWRNRPRPDEIDKIVGALPGSENLSEEQMGAVRRSLTESVLILTGGPGTGKTHTTNFIVQALEKAGRRIQIAAPTGRAAKRAAEVSGREAKTIHRLLSFDPEKKGFKHGPGEPLECDVLVIDESSMLDLQLTFNTLRAIPDGAQILFVGDVDQLPSVGPGNVLKDLIDSGRVPVARLTQVFRQAAASKIITSAHHINRGKIPDVPPPSAAKEGADCVFLEIREDELPDPSEATQVVLQKVKGVVAKSLPALGFQREDITVLSPMQRGVVGVRSLNEELQAIMNPPALHKREHKRAGLVLREGDRVMQRRNNYDKNVFNGDIGHIVAIDPEEQTLCVEYPEGPIEYDFAETDELNHAFSLSVHKSQGSEYPACVLIVHTTHYTMLQRNLIYTALTRAKKFAVFVGTRKALGIAVRNRHIEPRHTRLSLRLQNLVEGLEVAGKARDSSAPPLPGRLF